MVNRPEKWWIVEAHTNLAKNIADVQATLESGWQKNKQKLWSGQAFSFKIGQKILWNVICKEAHGDSGTVFGFTVSDLEAEIIEWYLITLTKKFTDVQAYFS